MVLVLKKEVVKTNNAMEHEDTGKYRQLLVRTLHQCSVKFPDVAATVIPVVGLSFVYVTFIVICLMKFAVLCASRWIYFKTGGDS
jgi:hypothetical protein